MFGTLYAGELKKQTSLKTVVIMAVIALLILIILAAVFDSVNELIFETEAGDLGISGDVVIPGKDVGETFAETWNYTEASVNAEIAQCEYMLGELEARKEEEGSAYYRNSDYLYYMRAKLALLEYIKDNRLYDRARASPPILSACSR